MLKLDVKVLAPVQLEARQPPDLPGSLGPRELCGPCFLGVNAAKCMRASPSQTGTTPMQKELKYIYIYNSCIYIYIYIDISVCMCLCVCVSVCLSIRLCLSVWMDERLDGWMDGWMDGCMHACMYGNRRNAMCIQTYIHYITLHLHLHLHLRLHYIHTYKHIYIPICNISTPAAPLGTDPPQTGQEVCPLRLGWLDYHAIKLQEL